MKLNITLILLTFLYIDLGQYAPLPAQGDEQTYKSIHDDMEIMETILDKMFSKQKGKIRLFSGGTNGYYLDDYGVLFKVPYSLHHIYFAEKEAEEAFELALRHYKNVISSRKVKNKGDMERESQEKYDKEISKIKNTLARFLGDYASTMNYLKPNYWITVIVDLNGSVKLFDEFYTRKKVQQLVAKVQMKDITAYRKGTMTFEEFKRKIQYASKSDNASAMDEDIGIFSDIIESYLERNKKHEKFDISDDVKGFYLNGYGAIFMLNADVKPNIISIITKSDGKKDFTFNTITSTGDTENVKEKIESLQNKIVTLVSRYGHTLRWLNNDESLEIALNINAHDLDEDFSKVILKIRKKYIDNLNQQKINLDEFKRRIRVVRY